jgi:Protein of unknown function (DUF1236)
MLNETSGGSTCAFSNDACRRICRRAREMTLLGIGPEQSWFERLAPAHTQPKESYMRRTLLIGVTALALASPIAAFGQTVGVQVGPVGAGISFAPEQRTHIREYVTRQRVAPVTVKERVAVGTRLPADVELRSVPADWGPSVTKYRYVYSNDRVYFVEPSTREVIYEVD